MKIGKTIKEIRKSKELSQLELADKIGISQTSLSQIESDLKRPSEKTLAKICSALEISEALIYMASVNEDDVPEQKRELFKILYPSIKSMILQIAG